ncbi:MAG TPA: winged helix DNA-binding domain-containing protein [Kribbellaceae bacterium]|nr:winged helix DNA-binding domain-containing protein [Kribbellaceae bacterium]
MTVVELGQRALNRALLGRQHLLSRATMPAVEMVEHLVGLQAQAPLAPYVGLWSRIAAFAPDELASLLTSRRVVRSSLMRSTVHLATDSDALTLPPLLREMNAAGFAGHFANRLGGMDVDAVVRAGAELLAERPRTRAELKNLLGARWPQWDPGSMAYATSYLVPTVQVTPRGLWGRNGPAALTALETWLGRPLGPTASIDAVVRRYVAAFGPASVKDVQMWSGLTRLREVVERLDLRRYTDADGNELYDVPEAALPDPDTPAPVRFLPEYDNVLLSHADRSRIIPTGRRVPLPPGNGASTGTVLVDGMFQALWKLRRTDDTCVIQVEPFRKLTATDEDALEAEAARLVAFVSPEADAELEIVQEGQ